MRLSKHQARIVQTYAETAVRHFVKTYKLDCSISATRIASEVLSKFHFKVKPLTVEAKVYNELFTKKGRNPRSEDEFQEWLKEGAYAILVPGHVVAVINDKALIDLSINQSSHPEEFPIPPVVCDVHDEFLRAEKPIFIENLTCVMVYDASPNDNSYQTKKDWFDREATKELVKEITSEMKDLLKG